MAQVYADLIRKGKKTIEDVPYKLRAEVEAILNEGWCKMLYLLLSILFKKEISTMAVVYATLIIKGKKTIDQVPEKLREQVKQILIDLDCGELA